MTTTHATDVAVIGAGPSGLFAVFECGMLKMSCRVIDPLDAIGGQLTALYPEKPIFDIPGLPRVQASELVADLERQAAPFSPVYHLRQTVHDLEKTASGWRLTTSKGERIEAKAVIIAAGAGAFGPNRPPLPGIEAYEGKSVHYLVRQREAFRDKRVVIAGGGDSAMDWALSLSEIAKRVMVVHRRPKFRGAPQTAARLKELAKADKLDLVIPYQLDSLEGADGQLSAVNVKTLDGESRRLPADSLLPFFGLATDLGPIRRWGIALERDLIKVAPASCATNLDGVFAIGDIATYPGKLKLILCGFSEAAMAAHAVRAHIHPDQVYHFEYSTTQGVPGV